MKKVATTKMKTKDNKGLVNGLSTIEAEIMQIVWASKKTTVREVHEELLRDGYIPYTTIMASMHNLSKKGLLKQDKRNRAYTYSAALSNQDVATQIIDNVISRILDGKPDPILRHLLKIKSEDEMVSLFQLRDKLYA